ncbi:MAG TPA: pre-16S rRNA-processing nuclease YqgF [Phycisphaerales bacterium]|nr:pre-16S rRNA-processing nuclease YqgF [Phycisphaerales bacterium]
MRYMAIDFGDKRTGLAVCDADETIASPLSVLVGQGALAGFSRKDSTGQIAFSQPG